jgi:hypothetical protein
MVSLINVRERKLGRRYMISFRERSGKVTFEERPGQLGDVVTLVGARSFGLARSGYSLFVCE